MAGEGKFSKGRGIKQEKERLEEEKKLGKER